MSTNILSMLAGDPAAIAAGGLGLAQGVAGLVPSKADKERRRRMKEYEQKRAAGQTGLTDEQKQLMTAQQVNPVRQDVAEGQRKQAAILAGMGNTSAAAQQMARGGYASTLGEAAAQAARSTQAADIDEKRFQDAGYRQDVQEQGLATQQKLAGLFGGAKEVLQPIAQQSAMEDAMATIAGLPIPDEEKDVLRRFYFQRGSFQPAMQATQPGYVAPAGAAAKVAAQGEKPKDDEEGKA